MATIFEDKVRKLAAALQHDDIELRESARSTLRGFIDRIVIPPGDGLLRVVGKLGEMPTAAGARSDSAAVGNGGCGGVQQIVPAALLGGSVNVKTLAFLMGVPRRDLAEACRPPPCGMRRRTRDLRRDRHYSFYG